MINYPEQLQEKADIIKEHGNTPLEFIFFDQGVFSFANVFSQEENTVFLIKNPSKKLEKIEKLKNLINENHVTLMKNNKIIFKSRHE